MNLNNLASSAGFKGNLGNDLTFLILFLLVSFALSFIVGKHRLLASFLGIYVAYAIVSTSNFDFLKDPNSKTIIFLAIIIGFVLIFSRMIHSSVAGSGPALIAKLVIGAAIVIGLSLSIILGWYPEKAFAAFITPTMKTYFTGDLYKFLWAIAPLVYLGIVRKRMS